jgi:molybdopterin-binding protein
MTVHDRLLKPREAARLLGISFATIKHWILEGKIKTIRTPGGHHRAPLASLTPFLNGRATFGARPREKCQNLSGGNRLLCKVVGVRSLGLMAEVVVAIGEWQITAMITADALNDLQLQEGDSAAALIKSTQVMIERLEDGQDTDFSKHP